MVSIFTPTHKKDTTRLLRLYKSLLDQTDQDWQWVVLLNGDAQEIEIPESLVKDSRVGVGRTGLTGIGALKKQAVGMCSGEIVVEVDHDDTLEPDAVEKVKLAFTPDIDFVYSDTYHYKDGVTIVPFSTYWGWEYGEKDGKVYIKCFDPSPASMSYIWYAPDHLRAWRKSFYDKIGGHDQSLAVADDHDLVCRTYINGKVNHIQEPLYNYYHHSENTSGQTASDNRNAEIQIKTVELHDKYMQDIALKWSRENNLLALDLGGRFNSVPGFTSVDLRDAEMIMDLEGAWNLSDNSVGVIRAHHIIEHLHDTIHFFNEAYRVLAPGGVLLIEVPSTSGSGAFSDPTHVKFFNQRSFEYYTNQSISQYIQPQYNGRFQKLRIKEFTWTGTDVSIIRCDMIANKGQGMAGEKLM